MRKIIINGLTLSAVNFITGIPRYCREIILRLDKLCAESKFCVEYAYLKGSNNRVLPLTELKYIKPVCIPSANRRYANLVTLPKYVKKQNGIAISISPDPLNSRGHIACIHDLRPAIYKTYDSWHFKISFRIILSIIRRKASKIVTVSDYQNEAIRKYLKIRQKERISTIYGGWEHMCAIIADERIMERFPLLQKRQFYYALGSLAPHKNYKWIMEVAKRNPEKIFAIAGGKDLRNWKDNIETNQQPNVVFLGHVSDAENKALMQSCRAFLHPSKYEGFGTPPLEALACGAQIIISNATCLPEIYEDCAHYFDPDDYNVDLERLLTEPVARPEKILQKCSWDRSANQWYDLISEEASRCENCK